jgi:hypothetical protein
MKTFKDTGSNSAMAGICCKKKRHAPAMGRIYDRGEGMWMVW